ncbi:MAG: PaaI family thioesterase [Cellvibrionaceae bacterium]
MNKDSHFWKIQNGEAPRPPIARTLKSEFIEINAEEKRLSSSFEAGERFLNPAGMVQGGILTAMLDATMGPAIGMLLGNGEFAPTLDLNVLFISPGKPGRFICEATVINQGRSICYAEGKLFDDRKHLIATATCTSLVASIKN